MNIPKDISSSLKQYYDNVPLVDIAKSEGLTKENMSTRLYKERGLRGLPTYFELKIIDRL